MLYFPYISAVFLYYLFEVSDEIRKAIIRPVVRGPRNLSEFFFLIFEMFIKKKWVGVINVF